MMGDKPNTSGTTTTTSLPDPKRWAGKGTKQASLNLVIEYGMSGDPATCSPCRHRHKTTGGAQRCHVFREVLTEKDGRTQRLARCIREAALIAETDDAR